MAGKVQLVPSHARAEMANGFSRYKPMDEKTVRKAEVVENPVDARMIMVAKSIFEGLGEAGGKEADYDFVFRQVVKMRFAWSAEDVLRLSVSMATLQDQESFPHKAGILLSALINNGKGRDYEVMSHHFEAPIDNLGFMNNKNLTIYGPVGDHCGSHMRRGSIVVDGDAGDNFGLKMESGTIALNGNAAEYCGAFIEGGSIHVAGSVGRFYGYGMHGGELHIEGKTPIFKYFIKSNGKLFHRGKIYHRGTLVVGKKEYK